MIEGAGKSCGDVADQVSALVREHLTHRDYDSAEVVGRGIEELARAAGHLLSIRDVNLDASPPTAEVRIPKEVWDEEAYCVELQLVFGSAVRLVPYIGPLGHTRGG